MSNAVSLDACMFEEMNSSEMLDVDGGNWAQAGQVFIGTLKVAGGVVVSAAGAPWLGVTIVGGGIHMIGSAIR